MNKIKFKSNTYYFDEYFDYLKDNLNCIPNHLRDFIMDYDRYSLLSNKSLHDSVLIGFYYKYDIEHSCDSAVVEFLGPYNDVKYKYTFSNIKEIKLNSDIKEMRNVDLIIHQFQFMGKDIFSYEFIFSNKQKITIKFKYLEISIEDIVK